GPYRTVVASRVPHRWEQLLRVTGNQPRWRPYTDPPLERVHVPRPVGADRVPLPPRHHPAPWPVGRVARGYGNHRHAGSPARAGVPAAAVRCGWRLWWGNGHSGPSATG